MADPRQLRRLRKSVKAWNGWRRAHRSIPIDLTGADLFGTDLTRADLSRANLQRADLREACLFHANLQEADLIGASLVDAHLQGANLRRAHLNHADLAEARLWDADLTEADLRKATIWQTSFAKANLTRTNFELCTLEEVNLAGVTAPYAYFVDARLPAAHLEGGDFSGAEFLRSSLTGAFLRGARLEGAYLNGADLTGADLMNADLTNADLSGTNLEKACLLGADLSNVLLAQTSFDDSSMGSTKLSGLDLGGMPGLVNVIHYQPSWMDVGTLVRSRGLIPLPFLRGVGMPKPLADHLGTFDWGEVKHRSCFISHSSRDSNFAKKLYADLQREGVNCWLDLKDISIGDVEEEIRRSIGTVDRLVLVLSASSMESRWVRFEIQQAVKQHRDIIPIALTGFDAIEAWKVEGEDGTDLAAIIRNIVVTDCTKWEEPEAYRQSFLRILDSLTFYSKEPPSVSKAPEPPAESSAKTRPREPDGSILRPAPPP